MNTEEYQGWKNRATWNVMLHINNEYGLYSSAVEFMSTYSGKRPYKAFIHSAGLEGSRTGDRFKFLSRNLCYTELNEAMLEFKESEV